MQHGKCNLFDKFNVTKFNVIKCNMTMKCDKCTLENATWQIYCCKYMVINATWQMQFVWQIQCDKIKCDLMQYDNEMWNMYLRKCIMTNWLLQINDNKCNMQHGKCSYCYKLILANKL